jgi:hypothetical protein
MVSGRPAATTSRSTVRRPAVLLLASAAFLLVIAGDSAAQNIGATLQGLITDAQKAVLPGVTVTITNVDTGVIRTVVTETDGWYRAAALQPGTYELSAELTGFVVYKRSGMTLTTGQEPRIDIMLQVVPTKNSVLVVSVDVIAVRG